MAKGHRLQPVDTDEDVRLRLVVATGQVELFPARGAHAHEYRVVAFAQERAQTVHGRVVANVDAHVQDHRRLFGQAKRGDVRAHEAAGLVELFEDGHRVPEGHEVVGDGERRWSGADAGHALAVLLGGYLGQATRDVAL